MQVTTTYGKSQQPALIRFLKLIVKNFKLMAVLAGLLVLFAFCAGIYWYFEIADH